jgi:hypothetical protein
MGCCLLHTMFSVRYVMSGKYSAPKERYLTVPTVLGWAYVCLIFLHASFYALHVSYSSEILLQECSVLYESCFL